MDCKSTNYSINIENLNEIPFQKYEKNFTFVVNGKQYPTNRFIADFLSPILRNAHYADSSINKYYITTNESTNNLTNESEEDYFLDFLNIFSYHNSILTQKQQKYFSSYFYLLGNFNEYFRLRPQYCQECTIENAIDILVSMTPIIPQQIEYISGHITKVVTFIASHFEEIEKAKFKKLNIEIIQQILSSESLRLNDEDSLIQFILSLYKNDHSYAVLFEYVNFCNVSEKMLEMFTKSFDIDKMNQPIWRSICKRLFTSKSEKNIKENSERYRKNEIKKENITTDNIKIDVEKYKKTEFFENNFTNESKNSNSSTPKSSSIQSTQITSSNIVSENKTCKSISPSFNSQNKKTNNSCSPNGQISTEKENFTKSGYIDGSSFSTYENKDDFYTCDEEEEEENEPIQQNNEIEVDEEEEIEFDQNVTIFRHKKGKEFNGIMRHLTNETGGNIHDNGTIEITSNSINSDSMSNHPKNLVDYQDDSLYCSKDAGGAIVRFDFKDKLVELSSYSIKSYNCGKNWSHLRNWSIEVSDDGEKWEEIDHHENDRTLNRESITATFKISKNAGFHRFVQLHQTGFSWSKHSSNHSIILFPFIEFYGKLKSL